MLLNHSLPVERASCPGVFSFARISRHYYSRKTFNLVLVMDAEVVQQSTVNPAPVDGTVLYDQEKHVSAAVWDGQERGALRCHEHTSKLDQWRLSDKQIELVAKAGFGHLRLIPAISLDNPLISALVERWRRETNTFHMNVGEMTVTLKDVALLLGLAIDGDPVIGITYTSCNVVCERYLGRAPEPGYASGGMVKLSWLKEFFAECPVNAPTEEIEYYTRAYLLYLVGSTIFSTTTGNKVPVMYLPLFGDFEQSGKYAWGAAALAFLYRALGNASLASQNTISGCLTLLQCWSYYHLNVGRPKLKHEVVQDCFPYVLRWKGKQIGPTANRDVIFYRKALDSLKPCDVEWLPYRNMDSTVIPEDIKWHLNLGRSKTMLICFDKAERHLPDRCLRQCGMPQPIPAFVPQWQRKNRGVDGGIDLSEKMELELNEWVNRRLNIVEDDESIDESEYMHWYMNITRRFVGRPISLSSEFQRTNSGLKNIAHIADTFLMEGLNPQQIESISRIRYIVHECLRGQVESLVVPMATIPLLELRKRARGKENVRRGSFVKHKHKDEPMEFEPNSEDDLAHYHGVVVKEDELPLDHEEMVGGTSRLCNMDGCLVSVDGDDVHLGTDADGEDVGDHRFQNDGAFNHEAVYRPIGCGRSQLNGMTLEIVDSQLRDGSVDIYETKCIDAINVVVDTSQLCCSSGEIDTQTAAAAVEEFQDNSRQTGDLC